MKWLTRLLVCGLVSGSVAVGGCAKRPSVSGVGGAGGGAGMPGGDGGIGGDGSGGGGSSGSGGSGGFSGGRADADFFRPPDGGGMPLDAASDPAMCGFQKYKLERVPPELLVVLDRSTSMNTLVPGSTNSRWTETTAALVEVLTQTNGMVSWGLKNYPVPSGCMVPAGADVPINASAMPALAAIQMTMPNATNDGGTPTAEAMRAALAYLQTVTTMNPKYLVLATDGIPTCPQGATTAVRDQMSIASVAEAKAAGFDTFVIGIATAGTNADRVLSEMAMAGGRARMGAMPPYYPVANRADLVTALSAITRAVSDCRFALDKEPPSKDDVAVNLDGMRVPRDAMMGWEYSPDGKAIVVHGQACEDLKAGKIMNVEIIFGCPNVPIP